MYLLPIDDVNFRAENYLIATPILFEPPFMHDSIRTHTRSGAFTAFTLSTGTPPLLYGSSSSAARAGANYWRRFRTLTHDVLLPSGTVVHRTPTARRCADS